MTHQTITQAEVSALQAEARWEGYLSWCMLDTKVSELEGEFPMSGDHFYTTGLTE